MNPSKAKGSLFARQVCEYLAGRLGLPVERRVDAGSVDRGDIAGVPGWAWEVKNCRAIDLAGWVTEAEKEAANARAPFYAVVAKRRMKAVAQSYVVMPLEVWCDWFLETR